MIQRWGSGKGLEKLVTQARRICHVVHALVIWVFPVTGSPVSAAGKSAACLQRGVDAAGTHRPMSTPGHVLEKKKTGALCFVNVGNPYLWICFSFKIFFYNFLNTFFFNLKRCCLHDADLLASASSCLVGREVGVA